ncbi:MAG TPA: hypothetical protein VFE92_02020 [Dermatophilaceae bacterium]|jgi:hypothetical protein|nr:hypothetical protein [Dermatophilaceae bacterium]
MAEVEMTPACGMPGRGAADRAPSTQGIAVPVVDTLVEAPACHLCDDATSALAVLAQSYAMTVQVVPIGEEPGRTLIQHHRAPMSPLVLLDGPYFSSGKSGART